jgi:hypothetical protein
MCSEKCEKQNGRKIMKYKVSVEKRMYVTGFVEIESESPENAIEIVNAKIDSGELQSNDVLWGEPEYEDGTFEATGDVDDVYQEDEEG